MSLLALSHFLTTIMLQPSIQKLVASVHHEFFSQLTEELLVGTTVVPATASLEYNLQDLAAEFSIQGLETPLKEAQSRLSRRLAVAATAYDETVSCSSTSVCSLPLTYI